MAVSSHKETKTQEANQSKQVGLTWSRIQKTGFQNRNCFVSFLDFHTLSEILILETASILISTRSFCTLPLTMTIATCPLFHNPFFFSIQGNLDLDAPFPDLPQFLIVKKSLAADNDRH